MLRMHQTRSSAGKIGESPVFTRVPLWHSGWRHFGSSASSKPVAENCCRCVMLPAQCFEDADERRRTSKMFRNLKQCIEANRTMIASLFWIAGPAGSLQVAPVGAGGPADEDAIREVIVRRRLAWNARDSAAYAQLLTEDADIVSATGRSAAGRDAILRLLAEQHAGPYRGVTITNTDVTKIKFVRGDAAIADADFQLDGMRADDGSALPPLRGVLSFVLCKRAGTWLISSIRGMPNEPFPANAARMGNPGV
ncbi:MAG TPA: SgcJ/EcaC family oxidoreductase [Quisquiliibacterium sp.]|nr:SgcJ/EcaC family oxidoreductase [Quisquiliibacterium sp.]HQP66626.1 SgcJ/EcaC family oxidoreductase [Quisquiliibacterium sp.]